MLLYLILKTYTAEPGYIFLENTVDQDQMASGEAI